MGYKDGALLNGGLNVDVLIIPATATVGAALPPALRRRARALRMPAARGGGARRRRAAAAAVMSSKNSRIR